MVISTNCKKIEREREKERKKERKKEREREKCIFFIFLCF